MRKFYKSLIILLALLLPWHGVITVFLPNYFRYWKELVIFLFFAGFCWEWFESKQIQLSLFLKKKKIKEFLKKADVWAIFFLIYGIILVLFSTDKITAFIAFRYLGLGMFIFLLFSFISQNFAGFKTIFQKIFTKYFIFSSILSVFFGTWIKFGNGAEITRNFYSQTISSWVPGQTIPVWHKVGDFVRLQGGASGPIEFAHLLLVAVILTSLSRMDQFYKLFIYPILFFGIYQTQSRAVMLGLFLFFTIRFWQQFNLQKFSRKIMTAFLLLVIFFAGFWGIKNTNILKRAGTLDHFTRPVKAVKFGLENIFSNNLAKLGPAARIKNLRENNDDKALIAENVLIDVFAQMGILGFILYLGFFITLWQTTRQKFRGIFLIMFLLMNFATIFDMTPVAISFFTTFWLGKKE